MEFLDSVKEMQTGNVDELIDFIFEHVNDLLYGGEFKRVDNILQHVLDDIHNYSSDALLSFLTITLHADNVVHNRKQFFNEVKDVFVSRNIDEIDRVLHGLEGKLINYG